MTDRRRAALALAAGAVPWALVPYEAGLTLVFSFGLVTPGTAHLLPVTVYVFDATRGLPAWLLAWPTATLLYGLGLASLALVAVDREDRRVTAGLFALAGLDILYFAVSFTTTRLGVVAVPLGVPLLWLAAWANRPDSWAPRV